jgi:hypothetical protein
MRVAIVHFLPLEKYPPVVNLLHVLEQKNNAGVTKVWTTSNFSLTQVSFARVEVNRLRGIKKTDGRIKRALAYVYYNFITFLGLIWFRPSKVLYYESLSALPGLLYKLLFPGRCQLYVHYHEYVSPLEYSQGMALVKINHYLEKKNYSSYSWISHTNEKRLELFLQNVGIVPPAKDRQTPSFEVLPNYPPASWSKHKREKQQHEKVLKIIYVGYSIEKGTSYIEPFLNWLSKYPHIQFDAYLHQSHDEVQELEGKYSFFSSKPAIPYISLPAVLVQYQVGVILYKPHIPNYRFNAPNKLFEYYNCGLDTWFPEEIVGSTRYVTHGTYPAVIPLNFNNLNQYDLRALADHSQNTYALKKYSAEEVLHKLVVRILEEPS